MQRAGAGCLDEQHEKKTAPSANAKKLDGIFRLHRIEDQMAMEKIKKGTEGSMQLVTTGTAGCYGGLYGDQVLHRTKKIADESKDYPKYFIAPLPRKKNVELNL
jgi:hypothetical protein